MESARIELKETWHPQASKRLCVSVATVNRDVVALKQEGKLRRAGSGKAGQWRVLRK